MAEQHRPTWYRNHQDRTRSGLDPGLVVSIVLALFAVLPLLTNAGLPNTADGPAHLMRQSELNRAWQDGILYPRWAPDLAYGYGMPLFSYAPPLLYHLTQLFHLPGLALDDAMKGTLILMMALCSVGMYLFARDLFGPRAGVLAAAAYLYAPYRLREAYVQGNYGQFCGLAFYPLILWSFYRLAGDRRGRFIVVAALSVAGLLLSHNISFMLFAPLLVAYLVYLLAVVPPKGTGTSPHASRGVTGARSDRLSMLLRFALATGLGFGLAAFFWLPAFGERDLIRLSGITTGFFDFRNNFVSLAELLALPRRLDLAAINPYFPLSLGIAHIVFVAAVLLGAAGYGLIRLAQRMRMAVRPSATRREVMRATPPEACSEVPVPSGETGGTSVGLTAFFAVALLAYASLALPESLWFWERIPLLELAEFPWRMLGVAGLCAAVLAGALVYCAERVAASRTQYDWVGRAALAGGLALTLAGSAYYLFPMQFIPWDTPTPVDAMAYEVQSGAIGTTSTGEFLPRWADRYPSPGVLTAGLPGDTIISRLEPASLPAGAESVTLRHTAQETVLRVDSPQPFLATFRALYWPGWQVWVSAEAPDDLSKAREWQPVTGMDVTRPDGLIQAPLPAGSYLVLLRLDDTPLRTAGWVISGLALLACVALVGIRLPQSRVPPRGGTTVAGGPMDRRYPRPEAVLVGGAIVVGLLGSRLLGGWLHIQSPPGSVQGVTHALNATFADQVRLLGYDLPDCAQWVSPVRCVTASGSQLPEVLAPVGVPLTAVLYWQALRPLDHNYSVFLHLDAPDGRTVVSTDQMNPEDIPSSAWPSTLYLRNPLTVAVPENALPIRYVLTIGLYDRQTNARLAIAECGGCAALPVAHVWALPARPLDENQPAKRLDYRVGEGIVLLGYGVDTGDSMQLTLYWRADAPQATAYTVFVHALDAQGRILAQADAPPVNGLYPTDAWLPGQIVADAHSLPWSSQVRSLAVGLYDPTTRRRLPVTDNRGQSMPADTIVIRVTHGQK